MSEQLSSLEAKMSAWSSAERFGYAVVLRRTQLQMKRKDLAERAELSYPYVSEIEKGSKEPSAKSLRQLASALAFASTAELLAWAEQQDFPAVVERPEASDSGPALPLPRGSSVPGPVPLEAAYLANSASTWPRLERRSWASTSDELADAIELVVRRVLDGVADDLRRELLRVVEAEVSRRLDEGVRR